MREEIFSVIEEAIFTLSLSVSLLLGSERASERASEREREREREGGRERGPAAALLENARGKPHAATRNIFMHMGSSARRRRGSFELAE